MNDKQDYIVWAPQCPKTMKTFRTARIIRTVGRILTVDRVYLKGNPGVKNFLDYGTNNGNHTLF